MNEVNDEYIVEVLSDGECLTKGLLVRCRQCIFWGDPGNRWNWCRETHRETEYTDYCSEAVDEIRTVARAN